jgi:LuxR family maltose regulon positive regulatory protein
LRLVSLALPKSGEAGTIEQFLDTFTGSHRPVLDYLIGDVFSAQMEPLQQFLLQTSILSRLTGSLCDAITGRDDSAQVLEQLERNNLFLVSLDASQRWYRFHALFAEAMQHYAHRRLGETRLHEFARMASLWYEEHGLLAEAVEASLFAQEHARAAGLIQRIIAPHLVQNENQTLRRWIEQIPEQALRAYPEICLPYATAILFTSDRGAPETKSRLNCRCRSPKSTGSVRTTKPGWGGVRLSLAGRLAAKRLPRVFSFAKQALARLPEDDRQWRGSSLIMLGMDQRIAGKAGAARQTGTEALALGEAGKNIYVQLGSMLLLGEVSYQQGELHHAAQIFNRALEMTENAPMDPEQSSIRRGQALTGLGMLALEWNDLQAAEGALTQAVATSEQFPGEFLLDDSPVILAQVKFARGSSPGPAVAGSLVDQAKRSFPLRFPGVYQARLALVSGDLAGQSAGLRRRPCLATISR